MQKACVVFTTIFDPAVLDSYYRNFEKYEHLDQVEFIVIPDRKTPESAWTRCQDVTRRGMRADCPTFDEQEALLKSVGLPSEFVPYNTDNRRNVGFLMALQRECDFIISLDDDNFARDDEDAFEAHAVVAAPAASFETVESSSGFFNICDLLEFRGGPVPVYPRGYPFGSRHGNDVHTRRRESGEIHLNAGLWLLDPDIDAISWLVVNPHAEAFHGPSQVLARNTWTPVNTQNTALRHSVLPSYYYIRMGYPLAGSPIDRYGDILSGYFSQACVKHLGHFVRAGSPVADHRRNSHNYMKDALMEFGATILCEDLVPWLREARLSGTTYLEAYRSLSEEIETAAERFRGPFWNDSMRGFLHQTGHFMRRWCDACEVILGS